MKKIIIISLFLLPFVLFSQDTLVKKEKKLSIGLSISPNFNSSREVVFGSTNPTGSSQSSVFHIGFNVGILFRAKLSERFEAEFGFQFVRKGYKNEDVQFYSYDTYQNGEGSLITREHFYEIPLTFNYIAINKTYKFYVTAGASILDFQYADQVSNVEISNGDRVRSVYKSKLTNNFQSAKSYNLIGGLGVGRSIKEKFSIRAEPIFRYLIEKRSTETNFSTGIKFSFALKV